MNWDAVFYEWFLAELIRSLSIEARTGNYKSVRAQVVGPQGHLLRDSSGNPIGTPRQSNLFLRPGSSSIVEPTIPIALGDGKRSRPNLLRKDQGAIIASTGLYPDLPRWTQPIPSILGNLNTIAGGIPTDVPLPFAPLVPGPELIPTVGGVTPRTLMGHRPRWGLDFGWLNAPRILAEAYAGLLDEGIHYYQGLLQAYWDALSIAVGSGLPLPTKSVTFTEGLDELTGYELYDFPYHQSEADPSTAVELGDVPDNIGLLYKPDTPILATLAISPPHVTIYPAGSFAGRTTTYWWETAALHEGPPGDEASESQWAYDSGLLVTLIDTTLADFITVTPTTLPVVKIGLDGIPETIGSAPADKYVFEPNGFGQPVETREWLFERTWVFNGGFTVNGDDSIVAHNLSLAKVTSPACLITSVLSSTQVVVSGTTWIKEFIEADEGYPPDGSPGDTELPHPPPYITTTDPRWWVDCVVKAGDYVYITAGNTDFDFTTALDFNHPNDPNQMALITSVVPQNPGATQNDTWVVTFNTPVNRFDAGAGLYPTIFTPFPTWWGIVPDPVVWTTKDTITVKARLAHVVRPGTGIYNTNGLMVETNWRDFGYTPNDPDPAEGLLSVLHTPGVEVEFTREHEVNSAALSQPMIESNSGVAIFNLAETPNSWDQEVHLFSPGNAATSMFQGITRIGSRTPEWDEFTAVWNHGYAKSNVPFRRLPLGGEDPWPVGCPVPPVVDWVNVTDDWPWTAYTEANNTWERLCFDPAVHSGSPPYPAEPLVSRLFNNIEHARWFDGRVIGHVLHPPNPAVINHALDTQNEYTRQHFAAISPTIFTSASVGTLKNPLACTAAESGGSWYGITIPTRWYDADAFSTPAGIVGVVLAWNEGSIGLEGEFTVLVSVGGVFVEERPLFHYFPDDASGQAPNSIYIAATASNWPEADYPKVKPQYRWMAPYWPLSLIARVGPFAVRAAGPGDKAGRTLATAFSGSPIIALVAG